MPIHPASAALIVRMTYIEIPASDQASKLFMLSRLSRRFEPSMIRPGPFVALTGLRLFNTTIVNNMTGGVADSDPLRLVIASDFFLGGPQHVQQSRSSRARRSDRRYSLRGFEDHLATEYHDHLFRTGNGRIAISRSARRRRRSTCWSCPGRRARWRRTGCFGWSARIARTARRRTGSRSRWSPCRRRWTRRCRGSTRNSAV